MEVLLIKFLGIIFIFYPIYAQIRRNPCESLPTEMAGNGDEKFLINFCKNL